MQKDEQTTIVFGEVLKELRLAKSYSQDKLGDRSGLQRNFIALLEKGERGPTLHSMLALADGLGLSFWELAKIFEERLRTRKKSK